MDSRSGEWGYDLTRVWGAVFGVYPHGVLLSSTHPVQVLLHVVAGDGRVGDEVKQLSDRHDGHASLHKELWEDRSGSEQDHTRTMYHRTKFKWSVPPDR